MCEENVTLDLERWQMGALALLDVALTVLTILRQIDDKLRARVLCMQSRPARRLPQGDGG